MSRGFIYAATGDLYVTLARRSARALRRVHPDAKIDLFTDQPLEDQVFNRVWQLEHVSRRPKIEALRRSRFQRSVYLDADTALVAPLDDVFDLLEHFDIAMSSEYRRNDLRNTRQVPGAEVPPCFPQLNSGVIAMRQSAMARALLADWHDWVFNRDQLYDQPSLRALLFRSQLRLHVLPPECNVMFFSQFMKIKDGLSAPRLIHQPRLHKNPPGDPMLPLEVKDLLAPAQLEQLALLLSQDKTLARYIDVLAGRPGSLLPHGTVPNPNETIGGRKAGALGARSFGTHRSDLRKRLLRKLKRVLGLQAL